MAGGSHTAAAESVLKIAIEGNIGAGKSTLLRLLSGRLNFVVVPEPVSKWTAIEDTDGEDDAAPLKTLSQEDGSNLLGKFYRDPSRWAFTFQSYAFLSRVRAQMRPFHEHNKISGAWTRKRFGAKDAAPAEGEEGAAHGGGAPVEEVAGSKRTRELEEAEGTPTKIAKTAELEGEDAIPPLKGDEILFFERSVLSDRFCFAANCRATGLLDEAEWRVYKQWWEMMQLSFPQLALDGILYLRTSPDTCADRMAKRGREEESSVDKGYLAQLHRRHEEWLVAQSAGRTAERTQVPVLVIDCDQDFEHNPERLAQLYKDIETFTSQLRSAREGSSTPALVSGEVDVSKAVAELQALAAELGPDPALSPARPALASPPRNSPLKASQKSKQMDISKWTKKPAKDAFAEESKEEAVATATK